jgi:hypothetical protein
MHGIGSEQAVVTHTGRDSLAPWKHKYSIVLTNPRLEGEEHSYPLVMSIVLCRSTSGYVGGLVRKFRRWLES